MLIIGCGYLGTAVAKEMRPHCRIAVTTRQIGRVDALGTIADEVHLLKAPEELRAIVPLYERILFSVGAKCREEYRSAYLQNAAIIAEALQRGSKKQRLIYTGSSSVYGDHGGADVDEEAELKAASEEGKILIEAERRLLAASSERISICIFRLGEITGPGRAIADRLEKYAGASLPGSGEGYVNSSPIKMVVDGIKIALQRDLKGVYNLCSEEHPKRRELYEALCSERNLPPPSWDASKQSLHGGNKRVSSERFFSLLAH